MPLNQCNPCDLCRKKRKKDVRVSKHGAKGEIYQKIQCCRSGDPEQA